jgi:hypothetical protein
VLGYNALQIQFAHLLEECLVRRFARRFLGARIPRLRSGFRQRARTPAVRLNLGEGKSEALLRTPSVPDLALSTPI